jgi:hypothetical protein
MATQASTFNPTHPALTRALLSGAAGGLIGGMMMAMFSMLIAIGEDGFWAPVRGITSVVFGDEHYSGDFAFWPVATGAMGHMMNAMVLGIVFAVLASMLAPRISSMVLGMAGAVYGLAVWAVMVLAVAPALQSSDLFTDSIPQWAWIAGHLMFGVITAMIVGALPTERR